MRSRKSLVAAGLAVLFLAACGSTGMDDVLGGSNTGNQRYEIRGTVESIDLNSRSMLLSNVSGYDRSMLSGGNTVRVYFDDHTDVEYQGQDYRPGDLERGDQVSVRVNENGNSLLAESVTVTYDATETSGYPSGSTAMQTVRGTVSNIDTSRRTIEIDRGYGSRTTVQYETSTPVYWNNQTYRVADLERGDEIEIRVRDYGSGRVIAQDVNVLRNVSSSGSGVYGGSADYSTIRGTVRSIDTSRRTIELESVRTMSSFNSGSTMGSRVVIEYGANTGVEVSGRMESITGLERGDVIEVQAERLSGGTLLAQRVVLVQDVRSRF